MKVEIKNKIDLPNPIGDIKPLLVATGIMLVNQVKERFRTQGRSGNHSWKPKVFDDGRSILTGMTGNLLNSFSHIEGKNSSSVFTTVKYAHVHQLGTTKYGGPIPSIVPKKAKALFIPITDRAKSSERITGMRAIRLGGTSPLRIATRGKKIKGTSDFVPLKRGTISKGRLMVWNMREHKYEVGTPDFIFLKKVDIPPRPMLPTSDKEVTKQVDFIASFGN